MSDNPYIVIFEYTKMTGGNYKCRFRIDYISKADFEARYKPTQELAITHQGVSEEEACRFLYTVPPLCHYLQAIEEAFIGDPKHIPQLLEMNLFNALIAVDANREYLWNHRLNADPVDDSLLDYYQELASQNSAKSAVMKSILVLYDFDLNDLSPLAKGELLLKTMRRSCLTALSLFRNE